MGLSKCKVGDLVELVTEINSNLELGLNDVMGMTLTKEIIPTKADINPKELPKFIIVSKNDFIYNPRTHGKKIGFGFNDGNRRFLISWNNIAFRIKKEKLKEILPYYLWMWLKREEWDRKAVFNSWGSSTEVFSWNEFCDMDITFPSIAIQQRYVDIYTGMLDNQKSYENGLDDLKITCDSTIENLRKKYNCEEIGEYINRLDNKNTDNKISVVKNVSVYKTFNEPTAKVNRNALSNYKIVEKNQIAFVQTTHNEKVFAYAINDYDYDIVVSSVDEVFETNQNKLLPHYLCLFFNRNEFDRYARYHSWGSARETFTWDDLINVKIPIPPVEIQQDLANIFMLYKQRKEINEELKQVIMNLCPILIIGSLREGENHE